MSYVDIAGQRFDKLLVIRMAGRKAGKVLWECQCDCGKIRIVPSGSLTHNQVRSCGCNKLRRNGLSNDRFYMTWAGIKDRCENPDSKDFLEYGGRGINICAEWRDDFSKFREWAIENYMYGKTVDRINNDGPYSPDNCRFATRREQANNRRNNKLYSFNDLSKTIPEWARLAGIKIITLRKRLEAGWTMESALTLNNQNGKRCHRLKRLEN